MKIGSQQVISFNHQIFPGISSHFQTGILKSETPAFSFSPPNFEYIRPSHREKNRFQIMKTVISLPGHKETVMKGGVFGA